MTKRYVATKGDAGWRVYDREKKDYLKNQSHHVRWFSEKGARQKADKFNGLSR